MVRLPGVDRVPELSRAEFAVLVSGIASMGLEILAGRIVAPEFGSSIYTWGSIIGVFLAALSAGYYLGGKRARREASYPKLAALLVQSALYVAIVVLLGDVLVAAGDVLPVGARYAAIVPVTLLFGPPTFLLGFISPYAAELTVGESTGEASGRVYAVGTVGSIVGTFATTFVLVPTFAVQTVELLFGGLLLLGAVVVSREFVSQNALRVGAVALLLVTGSGLAAVGVTVTPASLGGEVVYQTQTPYQQLEVRDSGDVRTLYLDDQPHSAMYLDGTNRYVFDYTRYFHLPYLFAGDPDEIERVLFVGGGGFSGPKRFLQEYPNATVDVVEIDPEVVRVAREYFGVGSSPRLNVHVGDGRQFLDETDHEYDLIVLDAYKKDQVPFHLTTQEFFELAESKLDEDGILFANLISAPSGPGSQFFRAEVKTLSQVYPQVYAFPTAESGFVQNIEVVATKNGTRLSEATLRARNERRDVGLDLSGELDTYRTDVPTDDVPVLTDDRAPVEDLLDPMLGRRYVIERTDDGTGNETAPRALARAALAG
jgi:spermidine synthase